MHMVQAPARWTAEMLRALPEDQNRYEVIGGVLLVSPGPSWTHQYAVRALLSKLDAYLHRTQIGHVLAGPADIEFSDDTLVQPDVFVVPPVAGRAPHKWDDVKKLMLVAEVISPASARTDRVGKRELYLTSGAPEYWVVDVDARLIERWGAGDARPEILVETIKWQPVQASEPFMMDLGEFFREILDG